MMSTQKTELLNMYLDGYNPQDRLGFCKLALEKHDFTKYSLRVTEINHCDYVIKDNNVRNKINSVINKGACSIQDFKDIFNLLEINQIDQIGY